MIRILTFIKSNLKEINPWNNIKILHTNIRGDVLSGITVAIIALPMALAFGDLAFGKILPEAGPLAGVWGAIVGGIVGGLFGGCMVGVSGPTSPKALQIAGIMLIFTQMSGIIEPEEILGAAFAMIFLSGLILIAISMLNIAKFIHYTPYPVIAGFMCGIGFIVIYTQINAFFGVDNEFNLQNINKTGALFVSIPSLFILFLWNLLKDKIKFLKHIPAPLVVLIIGTAIANIMDLGVTRIAERGMENAGTRDLFKLYLPSLSQLSALIGPAFSLAALAVLDSLLSCKVADNMTNTRHSSNRETFGQGMANMAAGLLGGVTTATATMRTVANIKFGAKTPLSSIVHGLTLLMILLSLKDFIGQIPMACLAAILIKVGIDILDYRILPILKKLHLSDLLVFIIVLLFTILFPSKLTIAVGIGIAVAFLINIKNVKLTLKSKSNHEVIPFSKSNFNDIKELPVSVLKPKGPLFFCTTESLINTYSYSLDHEVLIINLNEITMIDLSGAFALEDLIKCSKAKNIEVFVYNENPHIKNILDKVNFIKNIGIENYKDSKKSINQSLLEHFNL